MPAETASDAPRVLVACLCAAWCGLCTDYAAVFRDVTSRLAAEWPGLDARWVDIEDEAELCGELDIETFPTLLVGGEDGLRFAGVLEPRAATLERVLRAHLAARAVAHGLPQQAVFEAVCARLLARPPATA